MTIVVGVDGSKESLEALRWSVEESRLRRTPVRAVYVWTYPAAATWTDPFVVAPPAERVEIDPEELRRESETRLAALVAEVGSAGAEVEQEVIEGHPAEELVRAAKDAGLLVVGSRGHGGFSGLLLGSVSQACVHHAHCPVVVFRS